MEFKARRFENGQNNCVPQVVKASKSGWVKSPKKNKLLHAFHPKAYFRSILFTSQPRIGAKRILNNMEWLKPLCHSMAVMVSVKFPKNTSKSGIVPAIAPYNKALLPTFLPRTASPTAAPNTICVSESNDKI